MIVQNMLKIKYLAKDKDIIKIASKKTLNKKEAVLFTFDKQESELNVLELVKKYGNRIKFSAGIKPMITLEIGSNDERNILNETTQFLKEI